MTGQEVMSSKIYTNESSRIFKYRLTATVAVRIFSTVATPTRYTLGRSIPEPPTRSPLDGADATPERMMPSLSAYTPAATHLSQRPATIPVVPDLVDHIRQHIISRCIHRNAYSRGRMAILVLKAPASLRRLSYH